MTIVLGASFEPRARTAKSMLYQGLKVHGSLAGAFEAVI